MVSQSPYIADISFLVHHELYNRCIGSFGGSVIGSHLAVTVGFEVAAPFAVATGEGCFDLHFVKYLVFVFFLFLFNDLLTLIDLNRSSDLIVFDTFLVHHVNFCFFQFFLWWWWFLHFLVLFNYRRCKLFHFHFRRLLFWRRGWRRGRWFFFLLLLHILDGHFIQLYFLVFFTLHSACQ